jgi:hypothetical protein
MVCERERERRRGEVWVESLLQARGFAPCIDNKLTLLTEDGILMASARTENLQALEICLVPDDGFVKVPKLERWIESFCESIV